MNEEREKRGYTNSKMMDVPNKYEKGFIEKLDRRLHAAKFLRATYQEVVDDMGGEDSLSVMQRILAEKFSFLSFWLQNLELQVAKEPESKNANELYGRWVQGLNSLVGLSKNLGLERRTKKIESLQSYVKTKKKKKKVVKKKRRRRHE